MQSRSRLAEKQLRWARARGSMSPGKAAFLAGALQRHRDVRDLFPSLQASEIVDRLDGISEALSEPKPRPPERVPRTPEEKRALLSCRPGGWEYLLFAAVLLNGKEGLEMKWR